MRHKFLGTGEPGYHPLRKLRTVFSGLRYAVVYDFSVAYKLMLSTLVLAVAFLLRAWVDFLLILVVTAFVLAAEIFNSAIEALCDPSSPGLNAAARAPSSPSSPPPDPGLARQCRPGSEGRTSRSRMMILRLSAMRATVKMTPSSILPFS